MEILNKDGKLLQMELKVGSKKARTPEQEVIDAFKEKLNIQRIGTKYKPLTYMQVRAAIPPKTSVDDMWWFYSRCKEYEDKGHGPFSRAFFGSLRLKK